MFFEFIGDRFGIAKMATTLTSCQTKMLLKTTCKEPVGEAEKKNHYHHSRTPSASLGICGPIYDIDQVPEHFHELYILHGYRHPKSSFKQCILSLFDATNETLNCWTHFLPSLYFFWVFLQLSKTYDFQNDSYTWPLLVYMIVCCLFPLTSAVAHTFNTMSERARHICFFLDYSALSLLSLAVAIAYRAYAFPESLRNTWFGDVFIYGAVINSLICVTVSCETRFLKISLLRKFLRLCSFALPFFYDSSPIAYRLFFGSETECTLSSQYLLARQFLFAFLSAFLYTTHLPERLFPGQFDIIGHSHQLFHVFSILATLDQLKALLQDMRERSNDLKPMWEFHSFGDTIGIFLLVVIINTLIIFIFSIRRLPPAKKHDC
ncbi:membrane progestin receptor gamma [Patella vulgata]|uniref:membrane progestin receptor gamma n=1 Tax=Patella vulgata TaxID=6465 RepID=UPI0021804915|nr:membrane progestin receptor gamma [Patella vulgata]